MNRILRTTLFLLTFLFTTLGAETEGEFVARVTAAWQSNDPNKFLALYGESLKKGSEFQKVKAAQIEMEMKTRRLVKTEISPYNPVDEGPRIIPGKIVFMPTALNSIAMEMTSKDAKINGTSTTFIPVVKNSDGIFSFAVPTVIPFEWNGPQMDGFDIKLETTGSAPLPTAIVVFETCGYVSFIKMKGPLIFLGAHRIQQLIVSPVDGGGTVSIIISKHNKEPFFKKAVDVSKGAIVPIEYFTP